MAARPYRMQPPIPVIAILHDHLDVPSIVICSACSIESMCVSGSTENVVLTDGTGNKNNNNRYKNTLPPAPLRKGGEASFSALESVNMATIRTYMYKGSDIITHTEHTKSKKDQKGTVLFLRSPFSQVVKAI